MAEDTVPLAYTEWKLVELDGEEVAVGPDEHPPSLVLDLEESRVAGTGGVNRIMGTFTLSEGALRFGQLATTRMAGSEPAMHREQQFLGALERATSYELAGRMLALLTDDDIVVRLAC